MADRSCVAIVERDRLLLVRQRYRGEIIWTFPGGSIESGEDASAAAIREAYEEVGLRVTLVRLLCQRPRTTGTGTYYCFLGRIIGGQVALGCDPELPPAQQELLELAWFPIEQVQDHPEVQGILAALLAERQE